MAETKEALQDASRRNAELLSVLGETDYAPPALEQQNLYIKEIEAQIAKTDKEIKQLTVKRESELKDHERYQSSIMKRFAYRVTGKGEKFNEKASKEEREYFEALEQEHKSKRLKESLDDQLTEAKKAKAQLEPVAKRHADAQKDLDDLYNRIFAGPTPDFPEEDAAEDSAKRALETYRDVQTKLDNEKMVLNIYRKAWGVMGSVKRELENARSASRADMMGGGIITDMIERSALGRAENGVTQLKGLLNEAASLSPHVQHVGEMNIATGNLMRDVLFDNIFTDMAFHEKIKESQAGILGSEKKLNEQIEQTKGRINDLNNHHSKVSGELESARKELQRVRSEAFNRVQ